MRVEFPRRAGNPFPVDWGRESGNFGRLRQERFWRACHPSRAPLPTRAGLVFLTRSVGEGSSRIAMDAADRKPEAPAKEHHPMRGSGAGIACVPRSNAHSPDAIQWPYGQEHHVDSTRGFLVRTADPTKPEAPAKENTTQREDPGLVIFRVRRSNAHSPDASQWPYGQELHVDSTRGFLVRTADPTKPEAPAKEHYPTRGSGAGIACVPRSRHAHSLLLRPEC